MSAPPLSATAITKPRAWLAAAAALIFLVLGLNQASKVFAEIQDRDRRVGELQATADQQRRAGDFPAAWASLERASTVAERGSYLARLAGQPTETRAAVRTAQENLAMSWLEQATVPGGSTFADVVDPLLPLVEEGAAAATGRRRADLLAHVGWAHFLKSRDGGTSADPETFYREALAIDATNPYAHAHWGHLMAWTRRPFGDAVRQFDAALASGRARPYVRRLQLAALRLAPAPANDTAYLGAVADMVRNQEAADAAVRRDVFALYSRACLDDVRFARLTAAVPPTAQIAAIRALFFDVEFDPARTPLRDACLARLQESAGDRGAALETWRSILSALPPDASGPVAERARAAVADTGPALLR